MERGGFLTMITNVKSKSFKLKKLIANTKYL